MEIFNHEYMPGVMTVQYFAHLDQDVGPVPDDGNSIKLVAYIEPFKRND